MQKRRFSLPPLDLIQAFEAAARTLSFTKAGQELHLTQSAVSRQMRALEENLGVRLFERRHRALTLTSEGRALQRAADRLLQGLQEATDAMRAGAAHPHLCVTTTGGFASLWLIPRLRGFTALHPDVDVRISATYKPVNLERDLVDVAVRYGREEDAPLGAVRLFGEELYPVCSPALQRQGVNPLLRLDDLRHHALLHMADANGFDSYEQMIQAALSGQGVAMGIDRLVRQLLDEGRLVAPFSKSLIGARAYFVIRSSLTGRRAHVQAFVDWLIAEARAVIPAAALSSRPPEGRSGDAARRARSAT